MLKARLCEASCLFCGRQSWCGKIKIKKHDILLTLNETYECVNMDTNWIRTNRFVVKHTHGRIGRFYAAQSGTFLQHEAQEASEDGGHRPRRVPRVRVKIRDGETQSLKKERSKAVIDVRRLVHLQKVPIKNDIHSKFPFPPKKK